MQAYCSYRLATNMRSYSDCLFAVAEMTIEDYRPMGFISVLSASLYSHMKRPWIIFLKDKCGAL